MSVFDQGTGGFAFHPAHPFANGSSQAIFRLADELGIFNVETDRLPSLSTDQRARYLALPQDLPAQVTSLVEQGTQDRAALSSFNEVMREEAAMAWLARWFETGGFTYPLDAPDGDGTNNLEAIGDFLDRRSGYRVHCVTSLAVPGRARGAPTRAAIGYRSSEIPAGTAATTSAAAETAASSTEMTNTPQKEAITTQETPEMSATPAPPPQSRGERPAARPTTHRNLSATCLKNTTWQSHAEGVYSFAAKRYRPHAWVRPAHPAANRWPPAQGGALMESSHSTSANEAAPHPERA